MAYEFNGSTQYIGAPITISVPYTLTCWAYPDNNAVNMHALTIGNSSGGGYVSIGFFGASAGDYATAVSRNDAGSPVVGTANSSSSFSVGVWQHLAGVFSAQNSRTAYLNGTAGAANGTTVSSVITDVVGIGAINRLSPVITMNGCVADAAIWNVALTAAEIASLAKGVSPRLIRPQSLVFYAPLIRDLIDFKGATLTPVNSPTVATHPRIYL